MIFEFETDAESQEFCEQIAADMVRRFGISLDEAVGRINRRWAGVPALGAESLLYHESVDHWANDIYYGHDSFWWNSPPDLKPQEYP